MDFTKLVCDDRLYRYLANPPFPLAVCQEHINWTSIIFCDFAALAFLIIGDIVPDTHLEGYFS